MSIKNIVSPILLKDFFSWKNWSKKKRIHFLLNCFWGSVIAVLLHFAPNTGLGLSMLNDAYDFLVTEDFKLNLYKSEREGKRPISESISLIDFEKDIYYSPQYNKSSSPGFWTPRILLGQSILKAIELGGRVVVVDFELSKPIPVYAHGNIQVDENFAFLDLLVRAASAARENDAVIILAWAEESSPPSAYNDKLNDIIGRYRDVIKPGSAIAYRDPSDYQVRHFSFYETAETPENTKLSMQVQAAIYSWHGAREGNTATAKIVEKINQGFGRIFIPRPENKGSGSITLFASDPGKENLSARFLYRLLPESLTKKLAEPNENVFVRYPDILLRPDIVLALDNEAAQFRDKIIIIGSTNPEMGDIHPTPLGEVPGVFLVANGINMMVSGLQIHKPGLIVSILLECFIIIVTSFFFLHLSPLMAFLALGGLFYISSTSISLIVFSKFGMFVDFWLPMIGIGLHKNIGEIEKFIEKKYKK